MSADARRGLGFALVIVAVALNLRAFLTASSPLLGEIRAATGLDFREAAMLTVLPMLAMGPMSLAGVTLGRRLGERAAILLGLAAIALACATRGLANAAAPLLGSAVLAGLGVGLVQALMPAIIKRAYPVGMGLAMGFYSAALMGGGGLGAVGAPWVAREAGDWHAGLAVWALPALGALVAWGLAGRSATAPAGVGGTGGGWLAQCLRNRRAWLLALYFGLLNGGYTSLVAWLPPAFAQRGWSNQEAGALLALMTAAQVLAALAMPVLARGRRDLRAWLAALLLMQLAGFGGLLAELPAAAGVVVLLGFGLGGAFSLCMVLALDHRTDPAEAGALAAFMQCFGFMIAALAPFATGWVRAASGGFGAAWVYLAAVVLALLPMTACFDPRRHAQATRGLFAGRAAPCLAPRSG
ncbi:putative transporter YycB [Variovorax sp. PBL-H6]|uniref:cyanate transporter n=1 Tax=Variovorax sp. PBL-H6 TaxID=434009 RepID=UPI00131934C6|nr:cyanate transporter [Variovorax sp. PBL-H6]VTU18079.1 putative transporter YycB [Variovorax sp. PBL-H6]